MDQNDDLLPIASEKENNHIIKVIGVGGGGGNAVKHMFRCGIKDVDFILANTDKQALEDEDALKIPTRIRLGETLTQGLGAGNQPEQGRAAAIESLDEVRKAIGTNEETKMLFITAGMGGGTGTGAAPVIAKTALDDGILTVGIVTIPFRFEGPKRMKQALEGLGNMMKSVDSLLIIDNEKIREIYGKLKFKEAFAHADDILTTAAKSIAEIITQPGLVNVDFADVRTVMQKSGVALMGVGRASGENRAIKAAELALNSPLLNNNNILGAKDLLIYLTASNEMTLDEMGEINEYIQNKAGNNADLIWGNSIDESLGDNINVTVVATGFEHRKIIDPYAEEVKKNDKKEVKKIETSDKSDKQETEKTDETKSVKETKSTITTTSAAIEAEKNDVSESQETAPATSNNEDIEEAVMKVSTLKKVNLSDLTQSELERYEVQPAYLRYNVKINTPIPAKPNIIPVEEN